MLKLDLGSGPKECWVEDENGKWLHLDCEPFEGVIKWCCPDPIPVRDGTVDEIFMGQFLIELSISDHLYLAEEITRVACSNALLKVHCYGDKNSSFSWWPEFFGHLKKKGWQILKEEPVNRWEDEHLFTYLVQLVKREAG